MQFERFSKPCAAIELAKLFRWARLPQPSGCVKQGLGKALPNMIPMGQNERNAKTGTSVESCSLLLQTSFHFTTDIFSAKSRVCICKHFVNKLPSPAVRRCNSFCFYGIAAAMGLRHTNGNIGVTISKARPERFSSSTLTTISKALFGQFCKKRLKQTVLPSLHHDYGLTWASWQSQTQKRTRLSPCPICTSNLLIFIQS